MTPEGIHPVTNTTLPAMCEARAEEPKDLSQPDCAHYWPDRSGDPHLADWCRWCRLNYEIVIRPREERRQREAAE